MAVTTKKESIVDLVANLQMIPVMITLLNIKIAKIQSEAAWSLSLMAYAKSEYAKQILDKGSHHTLLLLLDGQNLDLAENVLFENNHCK